MKTVLFADDTSLLYRHKDINILKQNAETGFTKVYNWLISNKLSLSWDKTNFMVYHSPRKKFEGLHELSIYNHRIERINHIVYLGMHIDENLKWDKHISHICNNLAKNFHMFYSIRNLLTDQLKKQLYYSLVNSRISYGLELYGACSSNLLNKLQTMQNKLLKVLYNLPFRTDTNELHAKLNLLKVKDIYEVNILKFVYESVNRISIAQFHDYFQYQNRIHRHNTRNEHNLYPRRVRTKYGESRLEFTGSRLWNTLDDNIRSSKSLSIFKRSLKNKILLGYNRV